MNESDIYLRLIAIICFLFLHIYWRLSEKGLKKFLNFQNFKIQNLFKKSLYSYAQFFLLIQLLGLNILPIQSINPLIKFSAILLIILGLSICIISRYKLGRSWTNAKDYRTPDLVTNGPYRFVRHPIYLGLNLMLTGGEIIAGSYLIFIFLPLIYIWSFRKAKKEEEAIQADLGKKYIEYKSKTYMFIPFVI